MSYINKSKTTKVSFKVAVVLMLTLVLSMVAAPVMGAETGDIRVESEDANGDYEGDVVLYDSADNQVEVITADDGVATFEELQHGDYYLAGQDSNSSTVQSETFTHEADETVVEWDIEDNSLTVSSNEEIGAENPTRENIVDETNDPSPVGVINLLLGVVPIGIFLGLVGMIAYLVFRLGRR